MRNLLQISGISNILNMFNIHIVNRFLEGVMARSTNSSKKNTTTTKKAEAVKTAPVTKENVTEEIKVQEMKMLQRQMKLKMKLKKKQRK
jgi:hypothetical protein